MSDYKKIKNTAEYREARAEIEALIKKEIKPLQLKLDEVGKAVETLEKEMKALRSRPPEP